MLSLRGKLSRASLFRGWRASVPGKVSRWQPPPLLPKERWVQPPTLADLGTELSLLGLALPCCFSACCVTRWLLAPRHPGARPPAGRSDVVDAARGQLCSDGAAVAAGVGAKSRAAPVQSCPSPEVPQPHRANGGSFSSVTAGSRRARSRLPGDQIRVSLQDSAEPGLRPPGAPAGHPAPAWAPTFGTLGAFPGMSCGTGRVFPTTLSLEAFSPSVEGPVLCRVPGTAQPGDSGAWARREVKVQPAGSPRTAGRQVARGRFS